MLIEVLALIQTVQWTKCHVELKQVQCNLLHMIPWFTLHYSSLVFECRVLYHITNAHSFREALFHCRHTISTATQTWRHTGIRYGSKSYDSLRVSNFTVWVKGNTCDAHVYVCVLYWCGQLPKQEVRSWTEGVFKSIQLCVINLERKLILIR